MPNSSTAAGATAGDGAVAWLRLPPLRRWALRAVGQFALFELQPFRVVDATSSLVRRVSRSLSRAVEPRCANGGGNLILAIFVKESTRPAETQERAIAQIARAAYDYFLFNPGTR